MSNGPDGVVLTVRLIRSFEQRNIRHIVFKNVDLKQSTQEFMDRINADILTREGLPPPFRKFIYGTLKIQHKAHGAKSNDPVINTENHDILMLKLNCSLSESGVEHETELSYFRLEDYIRYKANPHLVW